MAKLGLIPTRDRVNEIARYYDGMGTMIKNELTGIDAGDYRELKSVSVREKVDKLVKRMNRFAIKWSKKSAIEAYKESMVKDRVSLDILGYVKDEFFDEKVHFHAVDKYREAMADNLLRANQSIKVNIGIYLYLMRKSSDALMQIQAFDLRDEEIIAGLLDDAIKEGASRSRLESLIRVHFRRELYEKKFININGRNYNLITYARNIARTRLREVQSEATKNMCEQFGCDLIEISSHGTECLICLEFEGNTYSIGGKTPGYPLLPGWPPYHNQCMHSASPTSLAAIEWRKSH